MAPVATSRDTEPARVERDTRPKSTNAKYQATPRLGLTVARRFGATVLTLSMFAGATGGMTVAVDLARWAG